MYPHMASAVGQVIYPCTARRLRHKELVNLRLCRDGQSWAWLHTPPDCLVEMRSFGETQYLLLHVEYDLGTRHDNTLHLSCLTSVGTRLQRRWGSLRNTLQVRCSFPLVAGFLGGGRAGVSWQTPGFGVNGCSLCQAKISSYRNCKSSGSKALVAWDQVS